MTEEIELTREELAALVTINDATKAGKPTSKETVVSNVLKNMGALRMAQMDLSPHQMVKSGCLF